MLRQREDDLRRLLIEFGMTPAARARVAVNGGTSALTDFEREFLDGSTG